MAPPAPIVDEAFDLAGSIKTLRVRIYAPTPFERTTTWACRTRLGPPFNRDRPTYGEGPLQALVLGLNMVAANLCSSDLQIDDPIAVDRYALGHSGLEALWRALCLVGSELYGSHLWRAGKLGTVDEPGGFLGVPPPTSFAFLTRHSF